MSVTIHRERFDDLVIEVEAYRGDNTGQRLVTASVKLSEDCLRELDRIAEEHDVSRSYLIRKALRLFITYVLEEEYPFPMW